MLLLTFCAQPYDCYYTQAGQRALELALGAYLSGATGRVVTLPLAKDHPVYQKGITGVADVEAWSESRTKQSGIFGLRESG